MGCYPATIVPNCTPCHLEDANFQLEAWPEPSGLLLTWLSHLADLLHNTTLFRELSTAVTMLVQYSSTQGIITCAAQ